MWQRVASNQDLNVQVSPPLSRSTPSKAATPNLRRTRLSASHSHAQNDTRVIVDSSSDSVNACSDRGLGISKPSADRSGDDCVMISDDMQEEKS